MLAYRATTTTTRNRKAARVTFEKRIARLFSRRTRKSAVSLASHPPTHAPRLQPFYTYLSHAPCYLTLSLSDKSSRARAWARTKINGLQKKSIIYAHMWGEIDVITVYARSAIPTLAWLTDCFPRVRALSYTCSISSIKAPKSRAALRGSRGIKALDWRHFRGRLDIYMYTRARTPRRWGAIARGWCDVFAAITLDSMQVRERIMQLCRADLPRRAGTR